MKKLLSAIIILLVLGIVGEVLAAGSTVALAPTTLGYHMADGTMAITFANETANPAVIVMTLRFTTN